MLTRIEMGLILQVPHSRLYSIQCTATSFQYHLPSPECCLQACVSIIQPLLVCGIDDACSAMDGNGPAGPC